MPWSEAVRLTRVLSDDPTSRIAAAAHDWDRPWSFEWAAIVDLFDLTHQVNADKRNKPKPYPRPWRDPNARRRGRTNLNRDEVIAILNAHGHAIGGSSHG